MTLNNIFVMNLTKYPVLFVFLCLVNSINAQCWEEDGVHNGYKINTSYTLDSLTVSKLAYGILDHSIALIDSFSVNRQNTWLYYVICLNSRYTEKEGTQIRIELKQGVDYNILMFNFLEDRGSFSGAFCYNGFTFFVLCENDIIASYNELFNTKNKRKFYVYYKFPEIIEKWKGIDYPYMEKFVYLFYQYNNGDFFYTKTSFVE